MGIQTEKVAGSKSTGATGVPKKDIDRIYKKYFLDYTPDPFTVPSEVQTELDSREDGTPESADDNTSRKDHIPSPFHAITRLWGKIDKAIKHERSKPMTFLVGTAQNVAGDDLQESVTVAVAIDQEEKILETNMIHSFEDGEEGVVEVIADEDSEEARVTTGTSEENPSFDNEIVHAEGDALDTPENERGMAQQVGSGNTDETSEQVSPEEDESEYEEEEEEISATADEIDVDIVNESLSLDKGNDEDQSLTREIATDDNAATVVMVETTGGLSLQNDEEEEESDLGAPHDLEGDSVRQSESDDSFKSPVVEDIDPEGYSTFEEDSVDESVDEEEFEGEDSDTQLEVESLSDEARYLPLKLEGMNFFQTFLIMRGLEAWVMTIILFMEWCRFYLSPVLDLFVLVSAPTGKSTARVASLRDSILARLRGGSEANDASSPSTDNDEEASNQGKQYRRSCLQSGRPNQPNGPLACTVIKFMKLAHSPMRQRMDRWTLLLYKLLCRRFLDHDQTHCIAICSHTVAWGIF
jgi:hypothetical protein